MSTPARADRVLVVGSGLAGCGVALELADRGVPCLLVTAGRLGVDCASDWAQGGLAAAMSPADAPSAHARDTLAAGAGLCDPHVVARVTAAASSVVERLLRLGADVERTAAGEIALGLEGGHGARRIVHAGGDASGHVFTTTLVAAVRAHPAITVAQHTFVDALLVDDGRVVGAAARVRARRGATRVTLPACRVVLATGGMGSLFAATTNPPGSTGTGLALGLRAGAVVRDLELVQFHPTALDVGLDPMPLVSEAVRGEGARLVLADGTRIPDDDLATRDVVARAVFAHSNAGRQVYLDTATALGSRFATTFPTVHAACMATGIDPARELVPVAPAAHYAMGGLLVDESGRTTVPGLWACGEVASTGLHGANRLASNSLLEAMAYSPWIADDIADESASAACGPADATRGAAESVPMPPPGEPAPGATTRTSTRQVLTTHAGVLRHAEGLNTARSLLRAGCLEADDRLIGALLVTGALQRAESRGGHSRTDFPHPAQPAHSLLTLHDARLLAQSSTTGHPERSAS